MRQYIAHSEIKTLIIRTLIGLIVYMTSLCFADSLAEPAMPKVERLEALMSAIIPDEPVIAVYIAGEGVMYFRESEIRPQDR
jgi:hypothetical protein